MGAERARDGGVGSRQPVAGPSVRRSSTVSAERAGGANAAAGATSAAGAGAGCEIEQSQPSAGAFSVEPPASAAQQQSVSARPQAATAVGR